MTAFGRPLLLLSIWGMNFLAWSAFVVGSEGDRSYGFQGCTYTCMHNGRASAPDGRLVGMADACVVGTIPWTLQLFRWTCHDDCKYECMHAVELWRQQHAIDASSQQLKYKPLKYQGKWPFARIAGMQEPLSVAMSIANLAAHIHCLKRLLQVATTSGCSERRNAYPYMSMWVLYGLTHINAWFWSAIFHCRDTHITERLDYCSADILVAVSLFCTIARTQGAKRKKSMHIIGALIGLGLGTLIAYMLFVKFDYGLNVKVCIVAGAMQAALWLAWCIWTKHPSRHIMYLFLGLVHAALLLEVLDFPPVAQIADAHSLWHACTVPLTYLFYHFLSLDAKQAYQAAKHEL